MNTFTERFRRLTTIQLLEIVEMPENYLPEAIEAAVEEISRRNLSEEEIQDAKSVIAQRAATAALRLTKRRELEDRAFRVAQSFFDTINPLQPSMSTERIIAILTIILVLYSVFLIISNVGMLWKYFTEAYLTWDIFATLILLEVVVLPVITYLFWRRRKSGWISLAAVLTFIACDSLFMLILTLIDVLQGEMMHFDQRFGLPTPGESLARLLVFGGTLWVIAKPSIREVYNVDIEELVKTCGLVALVSLVLHFSF